MNARNQRTDKIAEKPEEHYDENDLASDEEASDYFVGYRHCATTDNKGLSSSMILSNSE